MQLVEPLQRVLHLLADALPDLSSVASACRSLDVSLVPKSCLMRVLREREHVHSSKKVQDVGYVQILSL